MSSTTPNPSPEAARDPSAPPRTGAPAAPAPAPTDIASLGKVAHDAMVANGSPDNLALAAWIEAVSEKLGDARSARSSKAEDEAKRTDEARAGEARRADEAKRADDARRAEEARRTAPGSGPQVRR